MQRLAAVVLAPAPGSPSPPPDRPAHSACPRQAVTIAPDDTRWLNPRALVPLVVRAIQEVVGQQTDLELKVTALLGKFHALTDQQLSAAAAAAAAGPRGAGDGRPSAPRSRALGGALGATLGRLRASPAGRHEAPPAAEPPELSPQAEALLRRLRPKSKPGQVDALLAELGEEGRENVGRLYEVSPGRPGGGSGDLDGA